MFNNRGLLTYPTGEGLAYKGWFHYCPFITKLGPETGCLPSVSLLSWVSCIEFGLTKLTSVYNWQYFYSPIFKFRQFIGVCIPLCHYRNRVFQVKVLKYKMSFASGVKQTQYVIDMSQNVNHRLQVANLIYTFVLIGGLHFRICPWFRATFTEEKLETDYQQMRIPLSPQTKAPLQ